LKEKERYLKAMRALVYEKGQTKLKSDIPSICSCGAAADGDKTMCANNCQFYKNEKDYEKAMRDILSSMN
jgi:hypothetical protein